MPRYRVFYLNDRQVALYRQAAPKSPPYVLKQNDYDEGPKVDAPSPYAAWKQLDEGDGGQRRKLVVGDVLEAEPGSVVVMNFWGFDDAKWQETEAKPDPRAGESPAPEGDDEADANGETVGTQGERA